MKLSPGENFILKSLNDKSRCFFVPGKLATKGFGLFVLLCLRCRSLHAIFEFVPCFFNIFLSVFFHICRRNCCKNRSRIYRLSLVHLNIARGWRLPKPPSSQLAPTQIHNKTLRALQLCLHATSPASIVVSSLHMQNPLTRSLPCTLLPICGIYELAYMCNICCIYV